MRPQGHENVATVLVEPAVLPDFELDLMANDFRVWAVNRVPTFPDAPRLAFQIRRSLIDLSNGRWADAADWTLVWITFGDSWLDGDEPIPWPAHAANRNIAYNGTVMQSAVERYRTGRVIKPVGAGTSTTYGASNAPNSNAATGASINQPVGTK